MVAVDGAYFGTISKSGVVQFRVYEKGQLGNEYRAYLSRAECERFQAAVDGFVRKHGIEAWLAVMTDTWENRIEVQDPKGVKQLVFGFDRELACYDLPSAGSAVELWNTLLKTIESPSLRTANELIICAEPRKAWPRDTP